MSPWYYILFTCLFIYYFYLLRMYLWWNKAFFSIHPHLQQIALLLTRLVDWLAFTTDLSDEWLTVIVSPWYYILFTCLFIYYFYLLRMYLWWNKAFFSIHPHLQQIALLLTRLVDWLAFTTDLSDEWLTVIVSPWYYILFTCLFIYYFYLLRMYLWWNKAFFSIHPHLQQIASGT